MQDNTKLLEALELVIKYLDDQMEQSPSRELADVSNYLEDVKGTIKNAE